MTPTDTILQLRELHDRLIIINQGLPKLELVDEQTIDALGQLVTDLVHIYDRIHDGHEAAQAAAESSVAQDCVALRARISSFDSSHPRVGEFLREVRATLQGMLATQSQISQADGKANAD